MLETPCLLIDNTKMENNIQTMADKANKCGVNLRPHAKTHKIPFIAKKQIAAGAVGITVAKVSEAEVMVDNGIDNIFIAYPIVIDSKIERAIYLSKKIHLVIGVDSLEGAKKLSEMARLHSNTINVRLEIDTGLKRTGVLYEHAIKLACEIKKLKNLHLDGIYTFRGSILNGQQTLDRKQAGFEEGKLMVSLANEMKKEGIDIKEVSVGSTPTAEYAAEVKGITEVRPGTYVFFDKMQEKMGVCTLEECAATILTSIVSRPSSDLMIIDGGSKTFATDVQPNIAPLYLEGFGHIVNHSGAVLERLTEEHGMVKVEKHSSFKLGDTIQVIPNHICSTVNLHNKVYLKNENYIEEIAVLGRGKLD